MNKFTRRYGIKVGAMLSAMAASGTLVSIEEVFAQTAIGDPVEGTGEVGGELIVGIVELPDTLDPHKTGAAVTSTVLRNCSDPLIAKDFDGNYLPGLATSWNISEDGMTWAFTIRDGVTFQDGTPVTAEAVKASFDRILDPDTIAVTAGGLLPPGVTTELVDDTIHTVVRNLAEGGLLVVLVLLFLLGSLRGGLLVAASIPLSMLVAFIGMRRLGLSGRRRARRPQE